MAGRARVGMLNTPAQIRGEAVRVYKAFRQGRMSGNDMAKCAYMLNIIMGWDKATDLEADLEEIKVAFARVIDAKSNQPGLMLEHQKAERVAVQ